MMNTQVLKIAKLAFVTIISIEFLFFHDKRWSRQQRHLMELDRPPLADADFLRVVPAEPSEGLLWLAVRRVMADSIGLPREAVYPHDKLADLLRLLRMQWIGQDALDFVFRLERILMIKIRRRSFENYPWDVQCGQDGEFVDFAAAVVRELRELA